jgi:hypothetical protein
MLFRVARIQDLCIRGFWTICTSYMYVILANIIYTAFAIPLYPRFWNILIDPLPTYNPLPN